MTEARLKPSLRIVLADDEAQIRSFIKAVLKGSEYSIHEAGDGHEALAVIQHLESAPDLLITDIRMPHMDGLALARAVGEMLPNVPVLFISAWTDPLDSPEWGSVKYGFLRKPFPPKALMTAVEDLLAQPRTDQLGQA